MHTISIIIPVKPGGYVAACHHLKKILTDNINYEVLLAEGCAPSQQRNSAAREAIGDILYFLDDDSLITAENLALCCAGMSDPAVAVVGGPSVTPADDSWLQKLFGSALSSLFGSGAVYNRYRAHGVSRETTDKELILCNLAVRRELFLKLGGFNERLYPNEENEFLERVTSAGYKLLHDPSMLVLRSQRKNLKAFIKQMFSYGRGRAQQTLITASYSLASLIPLFFIVYLVIALIGIKYVFLLIPLMLYLFAVIVSTFWVLCRTRSFTSLLLPGLYPLMHIVNGVGLLWGFIQGKPAPVHDSSIKIRTIKKLGETFH